MTSSANAPSAESASSSEATSAVRPAEAGEKADGTAGGENPGGKAASPSGLGLVTELRPRSRLAVQVTVPGERCQASYDTALLRLSRSVRLPGFRKGKVPRAVLLQQLGPLNIRASALEELVQSVFREAVREHQIEPLSQPDVLEGFDVVLERFQPGNDLAFTLEMDVPPNPTLRATRGLKAQAESVVYDPGRVDELLEQSRRRMADLVPVEGRSAAMEDVVQVRFQGTYADTGEEISGGSSDGMQVELEPGRMIPGFVEGIVGMEVGETRTVSCTFPESYSNQEAAGRDAGFTITLLDIKTRELPDLDDAFAQQASDKQTLVELRSDLENRLRDDAEQRHRSNRREALLDALVEQLEVELPESLVQDETRRLIERTAGQVAQQGVDVKKLFTQDLIRTLMESSRPEAERELRRRLALQALATAEGLEVSDDAIDAKLAEVRRELGDDRRIDAEHLRRVVADDLLREALLDWLEENSEVSEKPPEPAEAERQGKDSAAPTATSDASGSNPAASERTPTGRSVAPEAGAKARPAEDPSRGGVPSTAAGTEAAVDEGAADSEAKPGVKPE